MSMALDSVQRPNPSLGDGIKGSGWQRRTLLALLIALAAVVLAFSPLFRTEFHSCATCGDRIQTTAFLGFPIGRTVDDTECGLWVRRHVESDHAHVWCRGTYAEETSLLGSPTWPSNVAGRASGPLVTISSDRQLAIYRCASNPHRIRDIFLSLAKWDRSTPEAARGQWQTLQDLKKWSDEGCQGDPPGSSPK